VTVVRCQLEILCLALKERNSWDLFDFTTSLLKTGNLTEKLSFMSCFCWSEYTDVHWSAGSSELEDIYGPEGSI
jgi:hypothetical protein